ncbi:MAG: hypothetical protein ACOX2O_03000 [Bdellovibrionota bacterium]|jgi:hypothetical protein
MGCYNCGSKRGSATRLCPACIEEKLTPSSDSIRLRRNSSAATSGTLYQVYIVSVVGLALVALGVFISSFSSPKTATHLSEDFTEYLHKDGSYEHHAVLSSDSFDLDLMFLPQGKFSRGGCDFVGGAITFDEYRLLVNSMSGGDLSFQSTSLEKIRGINRFVKSVCLWSDDNKVLKDLKDKLPRKKASTATFYRLRVKQLSVVNVTQHGLPPRCPRMANFSLHQFYNEHIYLIDSVETWPVGNLYL